MTEYIEREAALKCICSGCFESNMGKGGFCGIPCDDYERVSELHAADVRPVVRGKWVDEPIKGVRYHCSVCQGRFDYTWRYCPNCGAWMEKS